MTKEMTDKLISFDLESTEYTDKDGNFIDSEKARFLANVAITRMLSEEESKKIITNRKTLGEMFENEEMSITDMIESLVVKVDIILQFLQKEKEKVVEGGEEKVHSLDGFIYKAKVLEDSNILMVKIGTINELGTAQLYKVATHASIIPCLYRPEFYYIDKGTYAPVISGYKYVKHDTQIPNSNYRKLTPTVNLNQIIIIKDESSYTTGYITFDGVAIYYDQLLKE